MAKAKKVIVKEDKAEGSKLEKDLLELEKKFGLQSVKKGELEVTSSGSYMIDRATGIGGYPKGKIIEIWGPESSGKTTIMLHAIASFQKLHPERKVVFFDYEHAYDLNYATNLGVDDDTLLKYQPDDQEQGYDMICGLVSKKIVSLVVIDSQTAAIPKKIIEGDMTDATMALQARKNSQFLGKIKGELDRAGVTLLVVSQTRSDIGGMSNAGDTPTGGKAWKFYADMRLKVWKSLDKEHESNKTTLDVVKNKCSKPYGKAEFSIDWGTGINNEREILDLGIEKDIIKKGGSWYSYNGDNIGQGAENVCQLFKDNPELYEEIKEKVLKS